MGILSELILRMLLVGFCLLQYVGCVRGCSGGMCYVLYSILDL